MPVSAASNAIIIPDDWRCPRCDGSSSSGSKGRASRGGARCRKREHQQQQEQEGEEVDSEAEAEAVGKEVDALLKEHGVKGGAEEDEELAACLRREVERRWALGALWKG
jgi:hypothetical protein